MMRAGWTVLAFGMLAAAPAIAQGTGQGGCYFGQGPGCAAPSPSATPPSGAGAGLRCEQKSGSRTDCQFTPARNSLHEVRVIAKTFVSDPKRAEIGADITVGGQSCQNLSVRPLWEWHPVLCDGACPPLRANSMIETAVGRNCKVWMKVGIPIKISANVSVLDATPSGVTVSVKAVD